MSARNLSDRFRPSCGPIGRACVRRPRRAAFTLIELVVAIGVLVGVMGMVAIIFATATEAASKGTAAMNVQRQLRMARAVIQRDLAAFDPDEGALAIFGWEQLAWATEDDRATARPLDDDRKRNDDRYYHPPSRDWHRADVLFFTPKLAAEPYAVDAPGVYGEYQLVTYAHADQATLDDDNTPEDDDDTWPTDLSAYRFLNNPRNADDLGDEPSPLAASQWILARQAIVGTHLPGDQLDDIVSNTVWDEIKSSGNGGGIRANVDAQGRVQFSVLDVQKMRRAGRGSAGAGEPGGDFLYEASLAQLLNHWSANADGVDDELYYGPNGSSEFRRPLLDPFLTAAQRRRMGNSFLPGCVEFKVEITFDRPDMRWEMPAAPPNNLRPQPPTNWFTIPSGHGIEWVRRQFIVNARDKNAENIVNAPPRLWGDVIYKSPGNNPQTNGAYAQLYVPPGVNRDAIAPNPDNPPFPTAIRITLRVMDANGSLYTPQFSDGSGLAPEGALISDGAITETIIHRF